MTFLLDTNVCVAILADGWGVLSPKAGAIALDTLAISAVTAWELECGVYLGGKYAENRMRLDHFFQEVRVLPFGQAEARRAGELFAALERAGLRLAVADCMIAAHALAETRTLVTHDRDFLRVPGLTVADWLPPGYRRKT